MTTENITVLFTDLVGSTSIQTALSPDSADALRREHFTVLRQAITKSEGVEVKNLGDGLMVVFGSASAALSCAVAMQQGVELSGRRLNSPLGLRVGIASGEVSREDDDYFGDPVIEASRLCAQCSGGQILVTELARLTAGRRNPHPIRAVGSIELKGFPDPVDVVEIVWEPLSDARLESSAIPGLLRDRGRFPFAGRLKEFEMLLGAFQIVTGGATRLVLVAGEPGIGKTRLTSEFAERVVDDGGLVLAGRSDELVSVPYQPFVEALRWRIAQPGGVERLGPRASELTRLVPELAQVFVDLAAPVDAPPDAERLALFQAVREWLFDLTREQPVLLVLDDLHWADMGTLLLLRHVTAIDPVPRLMVVATYRDTDLDRQHPLSGVLAEFHRRGDVERLALSGLDSHEVTDLMTTIGGHELDARAEAVATTLAEETGGNPFFVGEVLRHLAESGAIVQRDGQWVEATTMSEADLPEGIRQVVGRRLSVLPETTQKLLSSASVIGTHFDLELLAKINDVSVDDVLDGLDSALAAHLVIDRSAGSYQFAHALVRSTLHSEITSTRRARLHLAVAKALEELHFHNLDRVTSDLAYHWGEVGIMNANESAFIYAKRAAEIASERLAPYEAAKWYRVALERLDHADPHEEAELMFKLGEAESQSGDERQQSTLLAAARLAEAVGNVALMTRSLTFSYRVSITLAAHGANLEKIALLERALTMPELSLEDEARVVVALAKETLYTGNFRRRRELALRARELLSWLSDPYVVASILAFSLGYAPGPMEREWYEWEREKWSAGAVAAKAAKDPYVEGFCHFWLAWISLNLGESEFRSLFARALEFHESYEHSAKGLFIGVGGTAVALIDGDYASALEFANLTVKTSELLGGSNADGGVYSLVATTQWLRETADLADLANSQVDEISKLVTGGSAPDAGSGLIAQMFVEGGRADLAQEMLTKFGANDFTDLIEDAGLPVALSAWSEVVSALGDERGCLALLEMITPRHDLCSLTGSWFGGSYARNLALLCHALGDFESAERWFGEAIECHERIASPPWLARTKLDYAERLLQRGVRDQAVLLARSALEDIGNLELVNSRRRALAITESAGW